MRRNKKRTTLLRQVNYREHIAYRLVDVYYAIESSRARAPRTTEQK